MPSSHPTTTPLNPSSLPPELLEQILLHLPQKDILLSQRISPTFRHTILGSPRLQKALFLLPDTSPSHSRLFTDGNGVEIRKPENNRLLLRAFPGCYPTVTLVIVNDGVKEGRSGAHSNAVPHATDINSNDTAEGGAAAGAAQEHWSWDVCISFPSDAPPATHPSVLYPEASWRRMFLSQPPCTSLHLVRRWQRSLKPAIVRKSGIRMGEFVDEAAVRREGRDNGEEGREAREVWSERYISSDRDWHFEGNIRCEDFTAASPRTDRKTHATSSDDNIAGT